MGNIPVGMEMFSAGDEQQWEIIKRTIDDCDYYVLILAHRYGSTDSGISYTEKEYDYAISQKIPVLAFIIRDDAEWSKAKMDSEPLAQSALSSFKEKVKRKMVDFWKNQDELHAKVAISLSKAPIAYPRPGWIRANETYGPGVMNELSRLSRENAELRAAIKAADAERSADAAEERKKIERTLIANKEPLSLAFHGGNGFQRAGDVSLFSIFAICAPLLLSEASLTSLAATLAVVLRKEDVMPGQKLRSKWPIPRNHLQDWLASFAALGLVKPSTKRHQVKDTEEYWSISELGSAIYNDMKASELFRKTDSPLASPSEADSGESADNA